MGLNLPLVSVSLSSRRAWIEIGTEVAKTGMEAVALLTESVDRNNLHAEGVGQSSESLSSRRAWIEIKCAVPGGTDITVALLTESVDRNLSFRLVELYPRVALLTESVDRNALAMRQQKKPEVALLTESVDRNPSGRRKYPCCRGRSPHGERG